MDFYITRDFQRMWCNRTRLRVSVFNREKCAFDCAKFNFLKKPKNAWDLEIRANELDTMNHLYASSRVTQPSAKIPRKLRSRYILSLSVSLSK